MHNSAKALILWLTVGFVGFSLGTARAADTNSYSSPSPARLWTLSSQATGTKLDAISASDAMAQPQGVKLLTPLAALQRGDDVVIPVLDGDQVAGKVNLVQQEDSAYQ